MLRQQLAKNPAGAYHGVPWRCHEISRIEALSDAVFAFAITLLIVALEVPETFDALWAKMHGFVAFAISFALLFHVWYAQHTFFRRYGLQDGPTVVLNGALLFLVLFYMYPLKFLFAFLVSMFTGGHGIAHLPDGRTEPMVANVAQAKTMMIVYAAGFIAVFAVFVLLYIHAVRKRHEIGLTDIEVFDARESIGEHLVMVAVGALSIAVLFATGSPGLSGFTYGLIAPAQSVHGVLRGRQRRRLFGV
ncbi:MAG TPA: TMEM175 family protein [Bryobacteraceae bacterium]|nr:TMEM175 family protein [Bryobacteraceae bacterium]